MNAKEAREQTKLWRQPRLEGVELLHATYVKQTFSRHMHEGFAIGVIEQGALKFSYRGENLVAPVGHINLASPGEVHDGYAATDGGWTYRMFYLDSGVLQQITSQMSGRPETIPFFPMGVIWHEELARLIRSLHMALEQQNTPTLEQESRLLWMLGQFVVRFADEHVSICAVGREDQAVNRVREYIEAFYPEDISIEQLSHVANLSPFHLIRVFRNHVGLPPHAYLIQVRVARAKGLLLRGQSISSVTFKTGFTDQSHFTRQFKRITGVTPSKYSKIIQDSTS